MHHHHHGSGVLKRPIILLIGSRNVGKSTLFYKLTGKYAWISNYPGTTVDISIGRIRLDGVEATVVDTPGMGSLYAVTEDEKVSRRMLLETRPDVVVHVVDASNMDRMLPLTLLLIQGGYRTVLAVNVVDELERLGYRADFEKLEKLLGIPVVPTVAVKDIGIERLRNAIAEALEEGVRAEARLELGAEIGRIVDRLEAALTAEYPVSKRLLALLLVLGDEEAVRIVSEKEPNPGKVLSILGEIGGAKPGLRQALEYRLTRMVEEILGKVLVPTGAVSRRMGRLDEILVSPLWGVLVLGLVLTALYLFVGMLGAQIVVDFLEVRVFEETINRALNSFLEEHVPYTWLYELIGGEYGIVTLGLRYAFAIILPIVSFFFIAFSIIEDSGYLPRLALLIDRVLKRVGLSGKAVIPLVLGLGCDTMATVTTRMLETRRERILATLMLALGIPCSAQLGVVMAMLPGFQALLVWVLVVASVLLVVAYIASRLMPGDAPFFIMELPPLRRPSARNVVMKTLVRLEWYLKEVVPLFVLASILIWAGRLTGVFDIVVSVLAVPVGMIGLPRDAATAFLYGFFRRDYGAAGLYDLAMAGLMNYRQILVSVVTITLFVPCIAQFLIMTRERGLKTAVAIFMLAVTVAFTVGFLVNQAMLMVGV